MSDKLNETIRIARRSKDRSDKLGRPESAGEVESTELELVSTVMLKQILQSDNDAQKKQLEEAAAGKDGVLAQNLADEQFEIIDDDDLMAALASADSAPGTAPAADVTYEPLMDRADTGDDELSLVSTQALRILLDEDELRSDDDVDQPTGIGGFDPYNSA